MLPQTEEVEERTGIASFNQRCLKGLCLDIIFNGVVEFLFIIAVYLRIKDYSGMNIKNSTMLHTVMFNVFSNGNQSDNI